MAFVMRSDRRIDLTSGEVNELGPGQYLTGDNFKSSEPTKVPFNSYTKRDTSLSKNDVPGPGSYEYDDRYDRMAKFINQNKEKEKAEPLYKYLDYNSKNSPFSFLVDNENKKAAFGTKDKRFKLNKETTTVPGPGFYTNTDLVNTDKTSQKTENNQKKMRSISQVRMIGSPQRVVTIPAKPQSFGYELNSKGQLVMNQDPDINIRYQGIKSDTVGPGSYNLMNSKDWSKNSMDWSKTNKPNSKLIKDSLLNSTLANSAIVTADNLNDLNSINMSNKRNVEKLSLKKSREKIFKQITENRKKMLDMNTVKDYDALVEKFLYSERPGPGYYYNEEETKAMARKPEKFQVFGSSSPRFGSTSDLLANEIGPGYYHKEDLKLVKQRLDGIQLNKNVKMKYLEKNSCSAERNKEEKEDLVNKIGPGCYEPKLLDKKNPSNKSNFGSLQKRFIEVQHEKESLPGPGAYLVHNNWGKSSEKENKHDMVRKYFAPRRNDVENNNEEKAKFEVPPVGSYDSDANFSLENKVKHKMNPYQSVIAPFSSMQKRFEEVRNVNDNLGPGLYYKERKQKPAQIYPPFNMGEGKLKYSMGSGELPKPGPGDYNQNSYFDWNKKSYNILYI